MSIFFFFSYPKVKENFDDKRCARIAAESESPPKSKKPTKKFKNIQDKEQQKRTKWHEKELDRGRERGRGRERELSNRFTRFLGKIIRKKKKEKKKKKKSRKKKALNSQ